MPAVVTVAVTPVSVRFFASLREAVGRDGVDLELREASIAGVLAALAPLLTDSQLAAVSATGVRVGVNQVIARHDAHLASGDEVAFLPPVTGG